MKLHQFAVALVCVVGLAGCGDSSGDGLKIVPAGGVVKYGGKPVPNVELVFYPDKGPAAIGKTDANGAFQLKTNGQLGGTQGKNKVTVGSAQAAAIPPSDGRAIEFAQKSSFNKKYSDQATTDLVIDLPAAGKSDLILELTD